MPPAPTPDIAAWLDDPSRPAAATIRRIRDIVLDADPRITELLKYGTLTFAYQGDLASFVQHRKPTASLMFNRGARLEGDFPSLEGSGPTARFMRFASVEEVDAGAAELAAIVVAWCELMDQEA